MRPSGAILGGVPLPPEAPPDPDAPLLSPTNLDGVWPPQPVNPSAVNLSGANLTKADLIAARLGGAWLDEADLRGAELALAILYEADLTEAERVVGILPMGAILSGAKNLTAKQVQVAQNWRHAHLPEDLQYLIE